MAKLSAILDQRRGHRAGAVLRAGERVGRRLAKDLERALFSSVIERCRAELDYNPMLLREMIHDLGAVGAMRRIINASTPSDGFSRLLSSTRRDAGSTMQPEPASARRGRQVSG